jgi:hypothetical protein
MILGVFPWFSDELERHTMKNKPLPIGIIVG